ncbi:MAG: helix-turn-helix domain-containing protein [Candidatus Gastranaerophilaceae bacterium]
MDIKKLFGQKIKEKRIAHFLTQEQLAEIIGISPKTLSQIELGNNFVSSEKLVEICSALNISPKMLFDYETENDDELLEKIYYKLKNNRSLILKIYKIIQIIE